LQNEFPILNKTYISSDISVIESHTRDLKDSFNEIKNAFDNALRLAVQ
jgi:hypothetical protein